jgi:hypothetical protein
MPGGQSRQQNGQSALAFLAKKFGAIQPNHFEDNPLAGPQLAQPIQVGRNHLGDFGITANRLSIDPQHDALAIVNDLHAAGAHRFGHHFALRPGQWFSLQPDAHAITGRGYEKFWTEKLR